MDDPDQLVLLVAECKRKRTNHARKVTRKTNELVTATQGEVHVTEIREKIDALKYNMEDLGVVHDDYVSLLGEDVAVLATEEAWYAAYDSKTNEAIKKAREYIDISEVAAQITIDKSKSVKLKKLEVPKFSGDSKDYYKWKSVYERFTKDCDEETRYDYLLTSTSGEARKYVENKTP